MRIYRRLHKLPSSFHGDALSLGFGCDVGGSYAGAQRIRFGSRLTRIRREITSKMQMQFPILGAGYKCRLSRSNHIISRCGISAACQTSRIGLTEISLWVWVAMVSTTESFCSASSPIFTSCDLIVANASFNFACNCSSSDINNTCAEGTTRPNVQQPPTNKHLILDQQAQF